MALIILKYITHSILITKSEVRKLVRGYKTSAEVIFVTYFSSVQFFQKTYFYLNVIFKKICRRLP